MGIKPLILSVFTHSLELHPPFLPLCIYVSFPTCRHISVNLAAELISQSGLRHVNLTEKGERTWHPLPRICRISALTKQSIHTPITFHLPQGVNSHCVLNRCACSDQFCLLDDCWVYGVPQTVRDNLTGYHLCYLFDGYDLMLNVLNSLLFWEHAARCRPVRASMSIKRTKIFVFLWFI